MFLHEQINNYHEQFSGQSCVAYLTELYADILNKYVAYTSRIALGINS